MIARLAVALVALAITLGAGRALAAGPLEVPRGEVAAGEPFQVQWELGPDEDAGSAELDLPPGAEQVGRPSTRFESQFRSVNGRFESSSRTILTWLVVAAEPGKLRVGPARVDGARGVATAAAVEVTVGPPDPSGRRRARRVAPDPFDPFGGLDPFDPGGPFGRPFDPSGADPDGANADLEDTVDRLPEALRPASLPSDDVAVVITSATPARAVVGQPIVMRVVAYGRRGGFRERTSSSPTHEGFLSYPVVETSIIDPDLRSFFSGGQRWHALLIRESVLVPVRSGELVVGSIPMTFDGVGYRRPKQVVRASNPLTVRVTEPPVDGRPQGYRVGDVGRYELDAEVTPREVVQGGAVSVRVTLTGRGNLPAHLEPPQRDGVVWLEPTTHSDVRVSDGRLEGSRTFEWLARLEKPGRVPLGAFELPSWDAEAGRYVVAKVKLGAVEVKPSDAPASGAAAEPAVSSLDDVLPVRDALGPAPAAPSRTGDSPWVWAALAVGPLGAALLGRAVGWVARRRARPRAAPTADARVRALRRALELLAPSAPLDEVGAAADALLLATLEASLGVRARALLRGELADALAARLTDARLVADALSLRDALEQARFVRQGDGAALRAQALDVARRLHAARRAAP